MGITGIENLLETDERAELAESVFAHIIRGDATKSASAIITEAIVLGTAVTALCGHTWIPSRNPQNHPVCPKCEEIFEFDKQFPDG